MGRPIHFDTDNLLKSGPNLNYKLFNINNTFLTKIKILKLHINCLVILY